MKLSFSSIQAQLISLVIGVSLAMLIFMVGVFPYKAKVMGNELVTDSSGLIVDLLSANVGLSIDAMILDDGASLRESVDSFQSLDPKDIPMVKVFDVDLNQIHSSGEYTKAVKQTEKSELRQYLDHGDVLIVSSPAKNSGGDIVGYIEVYLSKRFLNSKTTEFSIQATLIGGVIVFLTIILAMMLSRSITRPVKGVVKGMKALGRGHLDHELKVNNQNEIGRLSQDYNELVAKLKELIQAISASTHNVDKKADLINHQLEQLTKEFFSQKDRIIELVTRIEVTAGELQVNATESGKLATAADEGAMLARHSAESVSKIVKGVATINQMTEDSFKIIRALGERSIEIEQVLSVINDISEQTNLLALNAAIEAARAGEHGRGFAVVADEVRALSQKSKDSTEKISSLIQTVLSEISNAEQAVSVNKDEVNSTVEIAQKSYDDMLQMNEYSSQVAQTIEKVSKRTHEHSEIIHNIHMSVSDYSEQVSEQNTNSVQVSLVTFSELRREIDELKKQESQFKL